MAKFTGKNSLSGRHGSAMNDQEYLPLSWLSQADYCLRRAALLLNERIWVENADTAKGRSEHERVHTQRVERRGSFIKLYEYTVFSDKLGVIGKCDCIEATEDANGCSIPATDFPVTLYPVEYKHGIVRQEQEYNIQLCAQAMCLEEMFHTAIKEGSIFYISAHRRQPVLFDDALRKKVYETTQKLREVQENLSIPEAVYSAKCKRCSLKEYCMPKVKSSAQKYCQILIQEAKEVEPL